MASTSKGKRSRWGPETTTMGTTSITAPMTSEQIDAYILHFRIKEITQTLNVDDVALANYRRRSPSPEPLYDSSGKRINTHYRLYRESLKKERHTLIQTVMRTIPNYHPPQDYVRGSFRWRNPTEKVYIPVEEFPEVNFIGQLLGPRGRSLAEMNTKSHASIVIRGKGSVKEGKGRTGPRGPRRVDTDAYQEPLHCLITADTQESVDTAKQLVQAVIENAITTPEHENNRKRQQLRDLALANGTFRDDEGIGKATNMTHNMPASIIVCHKCDGLGHIARDCRNTKMAVSQKTPPWRKSTTNLEAKDSLELTCSRFLADMENDVRAINWNLSRH
ncbi:eukaryotic type KH-domain (KH-domain type I) [Annulohypoxylon truncatum]|uniref:eukaryotic type KH-domain (KH-domain type I) n=1 Tax=Annulohypoxylon truncatum TaxID=327061 RepID=UPI0020079DF0|nr:eukaryotic type KH-domain (KH-domain type I) [Annulohypoxylon truncatum]KAI1214222.1 eukaryotic type KH-domain (KH-domain type I) [Annulohypoxylon truncatum]